LTPEHEVMLGLSPSELTDLLCICADAINSHGLGAGEAVEARIAGNDKFSAVLTALGANDPLRPFEQPRECLLWGIAILLDGLQSAWRRQQVHRAGQHPSAGRQFQAAAGTPWRR
jgi:hypothetical protein